MQLMSSKMTFFYKRIFPIIWFGFLAVFFVVALFKGLAADPISTLPFLIVPVVMAVIGYQFMKRMAFNLVDEVFDVGDALLVRSGGQEERVALADIKNVNFFPYMSPPQVIVAAAQERVRRRDCVLCASPDTAPVAKPDDRKADRPYRCGAAERMRAAVPVTISPPVAQVRPR